MSYQSRRAARAAKTDERMEHAYPRRRKDAPKQNTTATYRGKPCLLQICATEEQAFKQAQVMEAIARTGYAPQVYGTEGNRLWYESVSGESFDEKFRFAILQDDTETLYALASKLSIFLQMFHSITSHTLGDPQFGDFVLRNDRCVCMRFDSLRQGLPYADVASVIACALTRNAGDYYAAFPFVERVLECFHLSLMDIINEVSEKLDAYLDPETADKNIILDTLMRARDGAYPDWIQYHK